MRKTLTIITTSMLLLLSGCNSEIKDLRKSVATINTEVKRTVTLYEESLEVAKALNHEIEPLLNTQTLLSDTETLNKKINPYLKGLYSFYEGYAEEVQSYNYAHEGEPSKENTEILNDLLEPLTDYTDIRYYYDDITNILEQMYLTTLPNGTTHIITLEWYKGELIKHEEMVSY